MQDAERGLQFVEPPIFERGAKGRSGVSLAPLDVPPASVRGALRRERAARRGGLARGERARGRASLRAAVAAELRDRLAVLSARLVHDEVQPEGERVGRAPAGVRAPAPVRARGADAGGARADGAAREGARRDRRDGRGEPSARGRRAGGARGAHDDPRVPRGAGALAEAGPHPGHGARDEPRVVHAERVRPPCRSSEAPTASCTPSTSRTCSTTTRPRS